MRKKHLLWPAFFCCLLYSAVSYGEMLAPESEDMDVFIYEEGEAGYGEDEVTEERNPDPDSAEEYPAAETSQPIAEAEDMDAVIYEDTELPYRDEGLMDERGPVAEGAKEVPVDEEDPFDDFWEKDDAEDDVPGGSQEDYPEWMEGRGEDPIDALEPLFEW